MVDDQHPDTTTTDAHPFWRLGGLIKSILFVDDETIIGAEFARALDGLGLDVEVAPTVESGLSPAQAILVEFNLRSERRTHSRSGNGLKVICELRALGVAVPLLIFSAMKVNFAKRLRLMRAPMTSS
jgi:ActR/RegA family two-component response regulator